MGSSHRQKSRASSSSTGRITDGGSSSDRQSEGRFRRVRVEDLLNDDYPTSDSPRHQSGAGPSSRVGPDRGSSSSGSPDRSHGRSLKCAQCAQVFSTREQLKSHCNTSHPSSYVCDTWQSSFFDRGNLNKHVSALLSGTSTHQLKHTSTNLKFH